jgi:mannose-1-phosphate guanylyltransferase
MNGGDMDHTYALIMAGGAGTRLWPYSRRDRPKPVLPLVEAKRSMFQIAVERLYPLLPPERIFVVANGDLTVILREQAPDLPDENFIIEPTGRDTAPAVGLGAIHIRHRDPQAIMAVLTADHHIADGDTFRKVLEVGFKMAAEENQVVTLGITPTFSSTGFGYIERGKLDRSVDGVDVFVLERFTEKPDQETAEKFIKSGNYSWNSGMFIWSVERVMSEFGQHTPDLYADLNALAAVIGQTGYAQTITETWPNIKRISVDYALMENIKEGIRVIPVEMGWVDIGSFASLYNVLSSEQGENVVLGSSPITIDSQGLFVRSKRLVATIGLEDLVIVDTDDVLLICQRDRAQDVKQIVEYLKERKRDDYL